MPPITELILLLDGVLGLATRISVLIEAHGETPEEQKAHVLALRAEIQAGRNRLARYIDSLPPRV